MNVSRRRLLIGGAAALAASTLWPLTRTAEANAALPLVRELGDEGGVYDGIGPITGSGNFTDGTTADVSQFQALNTVGAGMARFNMYSDTYYEDGAPSPRVLDGIMLQAVQYHIKPMLLFEFYEGSGPLGDYQYWFDIGRAFAGRFAPNGIFSKEHGLGAWGVTVYTAMNEPDIAQDIPTGAYHDALEGLADGVHTVSRSLRVNPGGFASANAYSSFTLEGYGPAIADLYNSGKLDGIDLHTYYDVQYAPMDGTYAHSANSNFAQIKEASGITADVNFYSTEYNFKERLIDDDQAAQGFLTGIWDNVGVVHNDLHTPATQFAFPWNIFDTEAEDPEYGLCVQAQPWVPDPRGRVLQQVISLTRGCRMTMADPWHRGMYILEGPARKVWVWQDREYWTDRPGSKLSLEGIPPWAKQIDVYGWDGLRDQVGLASGQSQVSIGSLPGDETYMFVASAS